LCTTFVEWVTDCLGHMQKNNYARITATPEAEDTWTEHVYETAAGLLFSETDSWFMGANIPGKKRTFLMYAGGSPAYRHQVADQGYEGFVLQ